MKSVVRPLFLIVITLLSFAAARGQGHGFPFGRVTIEELNMTHYVSDTSAVALVLDEFGEAYIDNYRNHALIFEYHVKIKILKKNGLSWADFSLPLYKFNSREVELLQDVQASSYSLTEDGISEYKLDKKNIFTEKYEEGEVKKFAVPNVQVGSIIEVMYTIETPNIFNFKKWVFQSEIPKLRSEYWALIPANYNYNIALKGYLQLTKNESELVKECFTPGGGYKADCSLLKFAMENVPAFVDEEFMTTSRNYISAITFELSEIKYFSGGVDKITKEWRDVEEELRKEQRFGVQLKRGSDIMGTSVGTLLNEGDSGLEKARKIYAFIRKSYKWNGEYGKYCEHGIKKAFEKKEGNSGDINLSLIAALRFAGLDADPVILSTRDHGIVTELYPVLSEFNYVVAKLTVGEKAYLLDATDQLVPFGVLPVRCLNGKGRVIGDRKTSWHDIEPAEKHKVMSYVNLTVQPDGVVKGTIQNSYSGYAAIEQRRKIYSFRSADEYVSDLERELKIVDIENSELIHLDSLEAPFIEKMEVKIQSMDQVGASTFLFNPFIIHAWTENPFKSSQRLYPVNFAVMHDERYVINITYPEKAVLENVPEGVALALPNQGGKFIQGVQHNGKVLAISNWLDLSRTVYTSEEYHYLKELFNRVVQTQNATILIKM